jgi:hypothetical protein
MRHWAHRNFQKENRTMATKKSSSKPDIAPEAEEQKMASPLEALQFLDGILGKVAGSRQDHIAIQGAIGIVGQALSGE